jgi:hypothetical protein
MFFRHALEPLKYFSYTSIGIFTALTDAFYSGSVVKTKI